MDDKVKKVSERVSELLRSLLSIPGSSTAGISEELELLKILHPDMRGRIDMIETRLRKLLALASRGVPTSAPLPDDLLLEYHPAVTDVLDTLLERADNALNSYGGLSLSNKFKLPERPLPKVLKKPQVEHDSKKVSLPSNNSIFIPERHPYAEEVGRLYASLADLPKLGVIPYDDPMEDDTLEYIVDSAALEKLAISLETVPMIAVDLEGHSFHSYYGVTCLLQLSTPSNDYIVDTISLRESIGPVLGSIFANPGIIKVFHGAQSDIQWLQRDFNIFIVNMFDTFLASKRLGLPAHSLRFLLQHYCNVDTDKQYQLADWRVRPLPKEMIKYARADTHYLLHIFAQVVTELRLGGEEEALEVFRNSSRSALALYAPEAFDPNGWRGMINKSSAPFGEREVARVKALYHWREDVARREDMSPPAVLPNFLLLRIAQSSGGDPLPILKSYKHPLEATIRHLDSMKSAMSSPTNGTFHSALGKHDFKVVEKTFQQEPLPKVEVTAKEQGPQPRACESAEPESVSIELVLKAVPMPSKVSVAPHTAAKRTLASAFTDLKSAIHSPSADELATESELLRSMAINRVALAAQQVFRASTGVNILSPSVSEIKEKDEDDKGAKGHPDDEIIVLKSGKVASTEAMLEVSESERCKDILISLGNGKRRRNVVSNASSESDLIAASTTLFHDPESTTEEITMHKRAKVGPTGVTNTSTRITRLSSAPKSGSRSMTFKN